MTRSAIFSPDCIYRYVLERTWQIELGRDRGRCLFVMLNPSTADALKDDPTIRRCIGFARDWGFSSLAVVNLFAYRTKLPQDLAPLEAAKAIGPGNDEWIDEQTAKADLIVAGWGVNGEQHGRDAAVMEILARRGSVYALGLTKRGHPMHPLYIPSDRQPVVYGGRP